MYTIKNSAVKLVFFTALFLFNACSANDQKSNTDDNQQSSIVEKTEEINEDFPEIIGTSWSLLCIYEKGTKPKNLHTFPEYLFCKNGKFEFHSLSNFVGQMGTYTIKGNRLETVNDGSDKLKGSYIITWNAAEKYLELNDGKLIFRLRYKTKTKC